MILNSNVFIFGLLYVWTTIYCANDLAGMVPSIFRRAIHTKAASIAVGMGTKKPSPMPHFSPTPVFGFSIGNNLFDLFFRVLWPTGHLLEPIYSGCKQMSTPFSSFSYQVVFVL